MIPVIYGWGKDLREVAYAGIEKCPNCRNHSHFRICEHSSYATLYFVKAAKWNKKLVYVCETCQNGWELDEARKQEALQRTLALPSSDLCTQMWNRLTSAVNYACMQYPASAGDDLPQLIGQAILSAVSQLKEAYQADQVEYVTGRYVAYLQDPDKPK